jgi:tRNA threonylcarbamoyladenosine biosynthesis protein TsaE
MRKVTHSAKETKKIAARVARNILTRGPGKTARVVAFQGDLGSGKTTFVQGFFAGLGLKKRAASPTFIIVRRTKIGNKGKFKNVFHMDAYRLRRAADLTPLGFKAILKDPGNILLVEWAENIKRSIPRGALWVRMAHGESRADRIIDAKI